ncbi:hypothetical protein BGZ61DRAFT_470987 [Ilyonectria robusta]|uniref:uncharacterized protein n=1 Tax=Ilyonectria robusta TaxID=1079257 RepID=UPI001E8D40F7|nr:uncharacterized protein BGZ61DRAFT_470987 [Ilyonectria robusta]KAH8737565.1 hypothetical protein BGZ61DRAFT_470987 [Ilyonectria robusta]
MDALAAGAGGHPRPLSRPLDPPRLVQTYLVHAQICSQQPRKPQPPQQPDGWIDPTTSHPRRVHTVLGPAPGRTPCPLSLRLPEHWLPLGRCDLPAVSFGPLTKPAPACTLALVALSGRVPAPERHLCMHAPADGRTSKPASEPAKSSIQRRHRGNDSVWLCEDAVGQRGRRMRQWRATDAAGGGRHDVVLHGCCDSVALYTHVGASMHRYSLF